MGSRGHRTPADTAAWWRAGRAKGCPGNRGERLSAYHTPKRARRSSCRWTRQQDAHDVTRDPELFDRKAAYLLECGSRQMPDIMPQSGPAAEPVLLSFPKHHHALHIL